MQSEGGLRDIVANAGAVYAVGSRSNTAGGSDWLVCKFSAALALVRCVGGTGGNSWSNINLRANAQGTQLFLSRAIAAWNPLVIFDADLRVVAAHGATVSDLAITASSIELPVETTMPFTGLDLTSRKLALPVSLETVAPNAIDASGLGPILL